MISLRAATTWQRLLHVADGLCTWMTMPRAMTAGQHSSRVAAMGGPFAEMFLLFSGSILDAVH